MDPLDALPDGVVVAGADRRVTVLNATARRMLGVADGLGEPLDQVLHLLDTDGRGWVEWNRPFEGLASRTGIPEQVWLLPDGTEALTHAKILRRHGRVDAVAITLRSGRGRARLDRERSDLVATLAHELRSPLTGVKGFVQALLNRWDKLNDDQKRLMLETVHADSDRLSRLIVELLDVARIDTGRLQLHPRPSDPGVLVARVVESVQSATSRPIVLSGGAVASFTVDPDKLTQVVTNLVENAVRHGDGEVRVLVDDVEDGIRIAVEDDGEGIPPQMRKRVFTKFWTGGQSGGSGLGLYLVGGLTRAHGGTVEIEDAPSGGARIVTVWPTDANE